MRHHLIISGTGRAGTTFLVQLLTELGLDTGFSGPEHGIYRNCDAGMELDLREPGCPYIVKSPGLCDILDELLDAGDVVIDHAIIPMRDLYSAAQSRHRVSTETVTDPRWPNGGIPGGLWHTTDPSQQESVLAVQLYKLVHTLTRHEVPITLLDFPRLAQDADYLYYKLRFMLGQHDHEDFLHAFQMVSKPALIHEFRAADQPVEVS